ncbi:hypothetical protein BH09BAC1_BH09BAC1_12080 [soil metagenome]
MPVYTNENIRQKVNLQLRECKEKMNTCPEQQKFTKLQQAALLCRLFQKHVVIDHDTSQGVVRTKALVAFSTPKVVILQDGTCIPINSIKNIDIV